MENKIVKYIWGPLRALLHSLPVRSQIPVLSVVTGVLCGLAAVLLKVTIRAIHHGLESLVGGANWLYLLLPGVGMLLSFLIVRYIVRDNIGHGVTKVLQAVSKNESKIKRHNMFSSLVTSALTIGFGGSVGAEAPIVYTGAAIGSNLGRYMGLSYRGMTLLLGCGAAGAVAGIFNAPLAGVLFTLEILLFNLSMSSLLPLLLSSVSATMVSYLILGRNTQFACSLVEFSMRNIPFYLLLGAFCGFCSLYFIKMTLWLEDGFGKMKNPWLRWALCALGLGLLIFLFPPLYGEGYDDVGHLLNGQADGAVWFFALILLLKVFAMTFTNAGGGVGGTFGPTLFVGAIAGYVLSSSLNLVLPGQVPVPNFVLVGMAGLMAGVMQAPLTAIFLIAEISGGYGLLMPLILTAAISYATTRIFEKYSIYTQPLAEKDNLKTHNKDKFALRKLQWHNIIDHNISTVPAHSKLRQYTEYIAKSKRNLFVVTDKENHFMGLLVMDDHRDIIFRQELYDLVVVEDLMIEPEEFIYEDDTAAVVLEKFKRTGNFNMPVIGRDRTYIGFLSKARFLARYQNFIAANSED